MSASRVNWILPVTAIALFAIVAMALFHFREPQVNGQTAGGWFAAAQLDRDNLAKSGAAFVQMEDAGVRYLVRRLTSDLPRWQRKLIELYNQHGTKVGLRGLAVTSTDAEKRTARRLLGFQEERAAPRLIDLLDAPSMPNQLAAIQALAELGPAASPLAGPPLVQLLNKPGDVRVYEAMTTLAVIGYEPASVVPRLVPFLQHPNNRVRIEASYALGSYPPMPAITLEPLIAALEDTDRVVRGNSARALGAMGAAAARAIGPLEIQLGDEPLAAARAIEALAMIKGGKSVEMGDPFASAHAEQLAYPDRYNRLMVLRASQRLGWSVPDLEDVCGTLLNSQSNWQVWEAVDAMTELDPRPSWVKPLLEQAAQHPNGLVRSKARAALTKQPPAVN